jgi:hypothetical protein
MSLIYLLAIYLVAVPPEVLHDAKLGDHQLVYSVLLWACKHFT